MYERFMQLLQEHDITAYRVAKETGVTQTTLSDWKTGRAIPRIATLQKIADYFGVSLDWLTGTSKYRNNEELIKYNEDSANWNVNDPYFEAAFDFANLLTPIRKEQGASLSELGSVIGASEEQMQDIENGILPITHEQAEKLCEYLGTDISQVLFDNQFYDEEVPEEYHDNVRAWEHKKKELEEEAETNAYELYKSISNPDILMVARAGQKMTPEQAENLRKYAQYMFPEAFKND